MMLGLKHRMLKEVMSELGVGLMIEEILPGKFMVSRDIMWHMDNTFSIKHINDIIKKIKEIKQYIPNIDYSDMVEYRKLLLENSAWYDECENAQNRRHKQNRRFRG